MEQNSIFGKLGNNFNYFRFIALCICGIILNLIFSFAAKICGLPVYLDTIGTIAAAVTGGYLPGTLVGLLSNLLMGIQDPSEMYYGSVNMIVAVVAATLSKKEYRKKISKSLLLGIFL